MADFQFPLLNLNSTPLSLLLSLLAGLRTRLANSQGINMAKKIQGEKPREGKGKINEFFCTNFIQTFKLYNLTTECIMMFVTVFIKSLFIFMITDHKLWSWQIIFPGANKMDNLRQRGVRLGGASHQGKVLMGLRGFWRLLEI